MKAFPNYGCKGKEEWVGSLQQGPVAGSTGFEIQVTELRVKGGVTQQLRLPFRWGESPVCAKQDRTAQPGGTGGLWASLSSRIAAKIFRGRCVCLRICALMPSWARPGCLLKSLC